MLDVVLVAYENFDTCEQYEVDQYLSSFGLSVDKNYRGRGIGEQLLLARYAQFFSLKRRWENSDSDNRKSYRKSMCKEFGLTVTHTIFSSDFSNRNAARAGFKTDVSLR